MDHNFINNICSKLYQYIVLYPYLEFLICRRFVLVFRKLIKLSWVLAESYNNIVRPQPLIILSKTYQLLPPRLSNIKEKERVYGFHLSLLGLMKVPKHISLNDVQSSFLSFSYQRWPHLLQITISLLRYNLVCVCHHKLFFFLKNICVCCKFIWSNQ